VDALASGVATVPHTTVTPRRHGDGPVTAVHDPALVGFLRDGHTAWRAAGGPEVMIPDTFVSSRWASAGPPASPMAAPGWWCIDTATPVVAGSYGAARAAVDVALTAAQEVLDGTRAAYAMTRPPGHHAGIRTYGGFCLLNPAAITARSLGEHGRVAVVDVDAHHGNGTQEIFWDDPQVLYASLHADPAWRFPYVTGAAEEVGTGRGRGTTRNTPLAPGTDGASYLPALTRTLEAVDAFDPATVVVSLGFDAAAVDPIGGLGLDLATYAEVGRLLAELDRPTVLVQEGGYAVDHLGELLATTLAPFTL
jgi:acetoin utilization deacetylase AcuC-like enzyme